MEENKQPKDTGKVTDEIEAIEIEGSLTRRLLTYAIIAVAVVAITLVVLMLPSSRISLGLSFRSMDNILNSLLLVLSIILLVLFVARIVTWFLQGRKRPEPKVTQPAVSMRLEGSTLNVFGTRMEIPETLVSMAAHVLQFHGEDVVEAARSMRSDSTENLMLETSYLFAFLEIMADHMEEAESSLFSNVTGTAGSLLLSVLKARTVDAG